MVWSFHGTGWEADDRRGNEGLLRKGTAPFYVRVSALSVRTSVANTRQICEGLSNLSGNLAMILSCDTIWR